jgi:hypothetical protein
VFNNQGLFLCVFVWSVKVGITNFINTKVFLAAKRQNFHSVKIGKNEHSVFLNFELLGFF